jgi:SAM-dependent methyltransferase
MEAAVGGEFDPVGMLERDLLLSVGLGPTDYLIDVGCGSGRLAKHLSKNFRGRYLGIDIVPELIDYARGMAGGGDWRFEIAEGLSVPEKDNAADIISFFSVFTHLLHEESFVYLKEAKRVIKPTGKIVFSCLQYGIHDEVFEASVNDVGVSRTPLTVFIGLDAIHTWASMLGLRVLQIHNGAVPHIPLTEEITFRSGQVLQGLGAFGQSVCIMAR